MVFSSLMFLFRFLPIALLLYFISPKKIKNFTIMALSLFFYSWGEPRYFPIMILSIVVDYTVGRAIESHRDNKGLCRLFLAVSIICNLGLLGFFKYTNFVISNLNALLGLSIQGIQVTLPIGISFYTFQTLSYSIDVYRGKVKAEKNIIDFGAFVTLFPQLIAGPIVKYTDISTALKNRRVDLNQIESGIELFIMGLGKKVLIANNIGALWTEVQQLGFSSLSSPLAWLGILAFTLQIYFDFSGYSLMAIGLGRILGFEFPPNFNHPYIAKSITEFWRRWHMTMSFWFRDYVYIPLGGSRVSKPRWFLNLFLTWFATGLWHGASWNFVMWGLYFLIFLIIEKVFLLKYLEKGRVWPHIYLLFLVVISWAIFSIEDMGQMGIFFSRLFSFSSGTDWMYYLRNYAVTIGIGFLFSTPLPMKLYEKLHHVALLRIAMLGVVLVFSVAYLVDATYNPFLYFRF